MSIKVIEHHLGYTDYVFGNFKTVDDARIAIAQAKATSGLPGYRNYSRVKFEIVEVKKGWWVFQSATDRPECFCTTLKEAQETKAKCRDHGIATHIVEEFYDDTIERIDP